MIIDGTAPAAAGARRRTAGGWVDTPTRWPAGANLGHVLGYLLSITVPVSDLPGGLRQLRAAAGLEPDCGSRRTGADQLRMRRRLALARTFAEQLTAAQGPPTGLAALHKALGDGLIHGEHDLTAALTHAGLPPQIEARALHKLLSWFGPVPWRTFPLDADAVPTRLVGPPATPGRRRSLIDITRYTLRRRGVMHFDHLLEAIRTELSDITSPTFTPSDWVNLLQVEAGPLTEDGQLVWLPNDDSSVLARGAARLVAVLGPAPLEAVGPAIARLARRSQHHQPAWPPPPDAIRAWAAGHPRWHISDERLLSSSQHEPLTCDLALALALAVRDRSLAELHHAVRETGVADTTAAMLLVHASPIPRRIGHSLYSSAY